MVSTPNFTLIKTSFQRLQEIDPAHTFVDEFYLNFVQRDPQITELFSHTDWQYQHNKFMLAFALIVENMERPGELDRSLVKLGRDHLKKYRVAPYMVIEFKDALLETLKHYLGDEWTDDVELAWNNGLASIIKIMFNQST